MLVNGMGSSGDISFQIRKDWGLEDFHHLRMFYRAEFI